MKEEVYSRRIYLTRDSHGFMYLFNLKPTKKDFIRNKDKVLTIWMSNSESKKSNILPLPSSIKVTRFFEEETLCAINNCKCYRVQFKIAFSDFEIIPLSNIDNKLNAHNSILFIRKRYNSNYLNISINGNKSDDYLDTGLSIPTAEKMFGKALISRMECDKAYSLQLG